MVYKIEKISRPKFDRVYKKSMRELSSFFRINWNQNPPKLILVPDRKTIDFLKGEKTEEWVIGWASKGNVYLLDDKNFEKESNHKYSDKEYFALIKHELAHCFSSVVSNSSGKPIWLLEGISIYLSGQDKLKTRPKKLTKFIDFFDKSGKGVYLESGFAVAFLVKKYGEKKLLHLLKASKEAMSKKSFAKLFRSIYGFELSYKNFKIA
ncbi:MAG: hypothetical protein NTW60_01495 [Candidatus Wolfebacteria bacterium]|nr:hypothetical protein [Candidatus Wolfebacteria bacterium]